VYTDFQGPYASGRSRHGAPVRKIQIIASTISRCGFALRPPVFVAFGSTRSTLFHSSSLKRTKRFIHKHRPHLAQDEKLVQ
jgi:hypothetical protein